MVTSFHARAIFMTDGGDNLVLLMALYLVLTACGRRWSLDARRHRRRKAGREGERAGVRTQLFDARTTLVTVLHNCGMLVIAAQVCLLYGSAGLYKVQGGSWGDGTALHFVLNLELFRPWPALSHLVDQHTLAIAVAGYTTVLLQVAFPFVLFGRLKYPVLTMLLGMHLGIAVLMGLPLFSGAMIVADAVFLPDRFYAPCLTSAGACCGGRAVHRRYPDRRPDPEPYPRRAARTVPRPGPRHRERREGPRFLKRNRGPSRRMPVSPLRL